MAIPQHTIDQILDRTDIVDLISAAREIKKNWSYLFGLLPVPSENPRLFTFTVTSSIIIALAVRQMVTPSVF